MSPARAGASAHHGGGGGGGGVVVILYMIIIYPFCWLDIHFAASILASESVSCYLFPALVLSFNIISFALAIHDPCLPSVNLTWH